MTAFVAHMISIVLIHRLGSSNKHNQYCVMSTFDLELFRSFPQALFFIVFIWTMFKMLIVWRTMKIEGNAEARLEKAQIFMI